MSMEAKKKENKMDDVGRKNSGISSKLGRTLPSKSLSKG